MQNTGTLTVTLPGECEIALTRTFNAPRHLVHRAFSEPQLLRRWFGPRGWTLVTCEIDARVGGSYRYILQAPDGRELGMRGTYLELSPPERSVHTESFDDFPGEAIVTTVFAEHDGRTTMVATLRYASPEIRDEVIQSGMEHGAAESYDRLSELLN